LPGCEKLGFRRIVVQPYFLFTGVLLKRIYHQVAARRLDRPDLDYLATAHLQVHPLLLDTFAARAEEALHGAGHMNCSLCQYRVPILGLEHAVGQPQQPHHHHVQGLDGHVHGLDEDGAGHHHSAHDNGSGTESHARAEGRHAWNTLLVDRLEF
jgi:sirohydrochlorin cobaltochelatase